MGRSLLLCAAVLTLAACNASTSSTGTTAPTAAPSAAVDTLIPSSSTAVRATPTSSPAGAVVQSSIELTKAFTSPLYRYSVAIGVNWQTAPAKKPGDEDVITATGTDTTIPIVVSPLGKQSYADWLKGYWAEVLKSVPPGCDGGNPSTWPAVTIGTLQGVWEQLCNAGVAFVDVGNKAYQFPWATSTFDNSQHLSLADFKTVLQTVTFP